MSTNSTFPFKIDWPPLGSDGKIHDHDCDDCDNSCGCAKGTKCGTTGGFETISKNKVVGSCPRCNGNLVFFTGKTKYCTKCDYKE